MGNWKYLGDGLYVNFDGYHVKLVTGSHLEPTNEIFLDSHVLVNLIHYLTQNDIVKLDKQNE